MHKPHRKRLYTVALVASIGAVLLTLFGSAFPPMLRPVAAQTVLTPTASPPPIATSTPTPEVGGPTETATPPSAATPTPTPEVGGPTETATPRRPGGGNRRTATPTATSTTPPLELTMTAIAQTPTSVYQTQTAEVQGPTETAIAGQTATAAAELTATPEGGLGTPTPTINPIVLPDTGVAELPRTLPDGMEIPVPATLPATSGEIGELGGSGRAE